MMLVIGYGNPLRGDDGLGWAAAQRLLDCLTDAEVEMLACHQLTPELAEPISRAERVIFIDAREGPQPGKIRCERVKPIVMLPGAFVHHITPEVLLHYAELLYSARPEALLLSVDAESFGFGEQLSPGVQAALPHLVSQVQAMTQRPYA